jgi:hypothetical protein
MRAVRGVPGEADIATMPLVCGVESQIELDIRAELHPTVVWTSEWTAS